jgi:hypothetical protein
MANTFHSTVAPWMNGQDGVQGYAPFGTSFSLSPAVEMECSTNFICATGFFKQMPGGVDPTNALMDGAGNPTALGRRYITNSWN